MMLKFIFPALKQNSKTPDVKVSKLSYIAFALLVFIICPFFSFSFSKQFEEHTFIYLIMTFVVTVFGYIVSCFFPSLLTCIVDSIFYKSNFSMLHFVRVLFPLRIAFVYMEILAHNTIPLMFTDLYKVLLDIWFFINMFISLRKTLDYNNIKASIPTVLYALCNSIFYILPT